MLNLSIHTDGEWDVLIISYKKGEKISIYNKKKRKVIKRVKMTQRERKL